MTIQVSKVVTDADRLGLMLFFAIIIHAIVILGVGFGARLNTESMQTMLDVILVQAGTNIAPEDADFIAQANQQGSGTEEEAQRPTSTISGPIPLNELGETPMQLKPVAKETPQQTEDNFITQQLAEYALLNEEEFKAAEDGDTANTETQPDQQMDLAQLSAELAEQANQYAKRPRVNFFTSVNAKSVVEASYIKTWVDKVERIGNLNYPDEARRDKLQGSLVLSAKINHDGRLLQMSVRTSSGEQVLDDAALRITKLAAPYAEFPEEMRKQYDQIVITRTWVFEVNKRLTTN